MPSRWWMAIASLIAMTNWCSYRQPYILFSPAIHRPPFHFECLYLCRAPSFHHTNHLAVWTVTQTENSHFANAWLWWTDSRVETKTRSSANIENLLSTQPGVMTKAIITASVSGLGPKRSLKARTKTSHLSISIVNSHYKACVHR